MDSEDDMHDASDVESLDDFYSGETAMASDDGDGDYEFNSDDSDDSAIVASRSVSKVHDAWFADEENVHKAVGLLEKPVVDPMPNARELTCGICFETYHRGTMNAAAFGHQFCNICWQGLFHHMALENLFSMKK